MPTLEISKKDLEGLVGKKFSEKELADAMLFVKGEIDKTEGDRLTVDIKETNRPDLWSAEGIARELRGRLGIEKGMPKMKFAKSGIKVIIDRNTQNVRPKVACALIKDAKITEESLKQLIQLQEKVCQTFGRKRKEAAIGVYEIDKLVPPIHYKAFSPADKKFVPLDFSEEMTLKEILEMHPKGKEYGHLIKGSPQYPVWCDSKGTVASLSPIINSELTGKISTKTKNVFVEVSGFDQDTVNTALLVVVGAFIQRGGKAYSTELVYPSKKITSPVFEAKKISVDLAYANKIIGKEKKPKEILDLLLRARFDAKIKGKKIEAFYPNYRKDILHPIDVIEDILISFGFNNFEPQKTTMAVTGSTLENTRLVENARETCIGLGLQEVLTFTMTSKEKQEKKLSLKEQKFVEIENPISANYEIFRKQIFPELLEFLSKNKKARFPQKIFEIGKALQLDEKEETGVKEKTALCMVLSGKGSDFSNARSALESVCKNFSWNVSLEETSLPFLEKGKRATVNIHGRKGMVGELSEDCKKEFKIEENTSIVEIELE